MICWLFLKMAWNADFLVHKQNRGRESRPLNEYSKYWVLKVLLEVELCFKTERDGGTLASPWLRTWRMKNEDEFRFPPVLPPDESQPLNTDNSAHVPLLPILAFCEPTVRRHGPLHGPLPSGCSLLRREISERSKRIKDLSYKTNNCSSIGAPSSNLLWSSDDKLLNKSILHNSRWDQESSIYVFLIFSFLRTQGREWKWICEI